MWSIIESPKWRVLLDTFQMHLCKLVIYYCLKEDKNAKDEISYKLTINHEDHYIYMLNDVTYNWPQRLSQSLDFMDQSLFKVFGASIKLKNMFLCGSAKGCKNEQVFVMQRFVPMGFFCICNAIPFLNFLLSAKGYKNTN